MTGHKRKLNESSGVKITDKFKAPAGENALQLNEEEGRSNEKRDLTKDSTLCMLSFNLTCCSTKTLIKIWYLTASLLPMWNIVADEHHKRPAPRPANVNNNNVYITRDSVFGAVCKKIRNIINRTEDPVILYAMGAAITRCCDIALAVQDDYMGRISTSVSTDTVPVVDDFEPLSEVCR